MDDSLRAIPDEEAVPVTPTALTPKTEDGGIPLPLFLIPFVLVAGLEEGH